MTLLHQLWAFLKRDYLLANTSRMAFAWQLLHIFFAAPILFYLGRLIQPAASAHLAPFGGDYFGFVILGVAFFGFLSAGMGAPAVAVRQEQMVGTLDALLATPISPFAFSVGASLWSVILAGIQGALYLLLGVIVFGLDFNRADILSVGLIIVLTLGVAGALGMVSAAFVLLFRHPDPIMGLITAASALLAGVFYPTSVLPPALQRLAQLIPFTHAIRALRLAALQGAGLAALQREIVILLITLAFLAPVAMLALWLAVRQAKSFGMLGGY